MGKKDEAMEWLRKVASRNKRKVPEDSDLTVEVNRHHPEGNWPKSYNLTNRLIDDPIRDTVDQGA